MSEPKPTYTVSSVDALMVDTLEAELRRAIIRVNGMCAMPDDAIIEAIERVAGWVEGGRDAKY